MKHRGAAPDRQIRQSLSKFILPSMKDKMVCSKELKQVSIKHMN